MILCAGHFQRPRRCPRSAGGISVEAGEIKSEIVNVKCVFKYPVKWIVKIDGVQPLTYNGWHFDFTQENDCISHIIITVPLTASDKLQALAPNPNDSRIIDLVHSTRRFADTA